MLLFSSWIGVLVTSYKADVHLSLPARAYASGYAKDALTRSEIVGETAHMWDVVPHIAHDDPPL